MFNLMKILMTIICFLLFLFCSHGKTDALKGMEKVAEHINEMQRIHEEYGAIFDHLFRQHQKSCKQPIDLSPGTWPAVLFHANFEWEAIRELT